MKLASQQHQLEASISTTSARSWKSSTRSWKSSTRSWKSKARGWHHNNISTKLKIFSTRLASQQHQNEARSLPHEAGITTTSARGWHHNNISTKLEIFSTRLASTLLPLSREVLSDYTKLISEVLKLYTR
jgi:hypothetical protein